jgi:NADH-quinone oxidoreductase subunit N
VVTFNFLEEIASIAPVVGLTILSAVVLLLDAYLPKTARRNIAYVSAFGMAILAFTPFIWAPTERTIFWGNTIVYDGVSQIFQVMVVLAGAIASLIAINDHHGTKNRGEYHLIVIISTLGACLLVASNDLIMIFVALETVSIPLYILSSFARTNERSAESGMKYFLFGSFASAILLFGFSLLFGFTGETALPAIAAKMVAGDIIGNSIIPVLAALLMVIVGFGFKISIVPFHFWTPDVYEGAPTPVTAFISVASKAASFGLLMRFLVGVFPPSLVINGQDVQAIWVNMLAIISVLSMTFGNILALRQSNIKRMLAYSSIAQAGYTLVGLAAIQSGTPVFAGVDTTTLGVGSVAFYLFMYTFSNLLIFAGIVLFTEATGSEEIKDLAGIQRRSPMLALAMTIGLLSLAGIPPAAGFFGKFYLFQAAVNSNLTWLAMIGVLNSIVALYYYLVVIKIMYVDEGKDQDQAIAIPRPYAWALGITAVVVLVLGVLPGQIVNWAQQGAQAIQLVLRSLNVL